jgi:hypothetical protein
MRAIMYHYVRPEPVGLPYFRYLHALDFAAQLDTLMSEHRVLGAKEFLTAFELQKLPDNAHVLTFDWQNTTSLSFLYLKNGV